MRKAWVSGESSPVVKDLPTLVLKARAPTNASVILTDSLVMLSYTVICNGCCWDYIRYSIFFYIFFIVSPNLVFVVCYQNLDIALFYIIACITY